MKTKKIVGMFLTSMLLLTACEDDDMMNNPVPEEVPATLTVNTDIQYQTIFGFGAMENLSSWQGPALDDTEIETLFGKSGESLGLNIMRIRIAPKDLNQDADSKWGEIAQVAKKAKDKGVTILATPWTAPAYLKTNNSVIGGEIKDYAGYADYLNEFLTYMKNKGVPVDILSIQNEPDYEVSYEGCLWTGLQQANFFKKYAPKIKSLHPDVKLMTGESYQFRHQSYDPILEDPEACAQVDYIGGHIYGSGNESYDLAKEKAKPCWMTEYLLNEAWGKEEPYQFVGNVRDETLQLAISMNTAMKSGMEAYIYWTARRFYSLLGDGKAGSEFGEVTPRGYLFGHFAHLLTGKTRVKAVASKHVSSDLNYSAYIDREGNITMMLINPTSSKMENIQLSIPFIPSVVNKTVTTIPVSAYPETAEGMMIESVADIGNGLTVDAYSVVTYVFNK